MSATAVVAPPPPTSAAPTVADATAHITTSILGGRFALSQLLDHLRLLALHHDELGQEIVLNETLRLLITRREYEQAEQLVANCELRQPYRSTNQAARFFYYVALIRAVRLDYGDANNCVQQALRKAPERALGFRIAATKLYLTLQLLVGAVPSRSEFLDSAMEDALKPYMQLTGCVRFANLGRFMSLMRQYQGQLEQDQTYSLILRARQNITKTGLRRICTSYSRISLADICVKLALENPDDAEYIVAKAVRDGVVDATIDHSSGTVSTGDTVDVYATTEPLHAFQRRTTYLGAAYADAQRALKYVSNADPELAEELKAKEKEEGRGGGGDDDGIDMFYDI